MVNGTIMYGIHISRAGILFTYDGEKIQVIDNEKCKRWLGEHEPDKYIELFWQTRGGITWQFQRK